MRLPEKPYQLTSLSLSLSKPSYFLGILSLWLLLFHVLDTSASNHTIEPGVPNSEWPSGAIQDTGHGSATYDQPLELRPPQLVRRTHDQITGPKHKKNKDSTTRSFFCFILFHIRILSLQFTSSPCGIRGNESDSLTNPVLVPLLVVWHAFIMPMALGAVRVRGRSGGTHLSGAARPLGSLVFHQRPVASYGPNHCN